MLPPSPHCWTADGPQLLLPALLTPPHLKNSPLLDAGPWGSLLDSRRAAAAASASVGPPGREPSALKCQAGAVGSVCMHACVCVCVHVCVCVCVYAQLEGIGEWACVLCYEEGVQSARRAGVQPHLSPCFTVFGACRGRRCATATMFLKDS